MRKHMKTALLLASCLTLSLQAGVSAGVERTYWGFGDEFFDDFFDDFFGDDFFYGNGYGTVQNENTQAVDTGLGSAGELEGKVLIVSLFLNDANTKWTNDDESLELAKHSLDYLKIAADWITEQADVYGKDVEFIYDWSENRDLFHTGTISADLTNTQTNFDWDTWGYIDENISSKELKEKYEADSVLYMVYVHTQPENSSVSCARSYYRGMQYPYEMCFMCTQIDQAEEGPAAYAHEILHAFGGKDLYEAYQEIPQEYVDYAAEHYPDDIMYAVASPDYAADSYDRITQTLSEISAYYLGLVDNCADVETFGLARSEHDTSEVPYSGSDPYVYSDPYGDEDGVTSEDEDAVSV